MCLLRMWQVGGVHSAIRKVPEVQAHEILQQGVPEKRLGIPQALVRGSSAIARPPFYSFMQHDLLKPTFFIIFFSFSFLLFLAVIGVPPFLVFSSGLVFSYLFLVISFKIILGLEKRCNCTLRLFFFYIAVCIGL